MDMSGGIIHKWEYSLGYDQSYFRRVQLLEGGNLLVLSEHAALFELDKDSNPVWIYEDNVHHDFEIADDGSIFTLTRKESDYPSLCDGQTVWDDFITILDSKGEPQYSFSIYKAFAESVYNSMFISSVDCSDKDEDPIHTNTLEIIPSGFSSFPFTPGNLIISPRNLNLIAVIDPDTEKVVWAMAGMWLLQHQPTLLDNGNILLFDNVGHYGFSKVIEFNPLNQAIAWSYNGNKENGFVSEVCGSCQRLPNNNTLITESTAGRVFEVTQNNSIVWEFINPERIHRDEELIAVIPEMVRLPPDLSLDWLD
jgi:hypothetical protein